MNFKLLLDRLLFKKTFLVIVSITILLLVHAWVFFVLPPNYGWWQTYAYLHESGLKLYQDINCAFPPLYVLVYTVLLKISDQMIVSTIFGFVMVLAIVFLMYKTLRLKYSLPYKELKYFKVNKATYDVFNTTKESILKYSKTKNDIYLYPHIPLLYFLHKRIPITPNITQWFDIVSTTNIKKELT